MNIEEYIQWQEERLKNLVYEDVEGKVKPVTRMAIYLYKTDGNKSKKKIRTGYGWIRMRWPNECTKI